MSHVTVNNRPLADYLKRAEALERQAEAEQIRLEEIRQTKRYRPVITRRLLLWMPKKQRERIDPADFERLVGKVTDAIEKAPAGLTYRQLSDVVGGRWKQATLSKVMREIGAARWRETMQGNVLVGLKLPEGRKQVGGGHRKRKMATPEQLAVARAKEAGLPLPGSAAVPTPLPQIVVPAMGTLRRELVEVARQLSELYDQKAAVWRELGDRLIREAPRKTT